MNQPLSRIPRQELVVKAVAQLRQHFHEHRLSKTEADVPWQVGQTMVEVILDMQLHNPIDWQTELSFIWGQTIRSFLRQQGFDENHLQIGNLHAFWMSFVKEAING